MKKHPHFVKDLYEKTRFDILCVQETKMQEGNVGEMLAVIEDDEDENDDDKGPGGLHHNQNDQLAAYFSCSTARKGYSGVAMITRPDVKFTSKPREGFHQRALDEADFEKTEENLEAFHLFNREGRVMTCELEKAVIINTYVPNSGEGLKRLRERIEVWEPAMKAHVSCLREDMMKEEEEKAIVWVGDFNVAHEKRDLWGNWTQNETSAGFTPEERLAFSNQLKDLRLTDSFRYRHPTADDKFTYWSYRAKSRERNRGWRIDYALVSDTMKENIEDAFIVSDFLGSDHCPLGVELRV